MTNDRKKIKLLIVDDEDEFRNAVSRALNRRGYDVIETDNGNRAVAIIRENEPDIVLLDQKMPGMDGIETLKHIKALNSLLPVVILTGHGTYDTALAGLNLGIVDFIQKPVDMDRLSSHVRDIVERAWHPPLREHAISEIMVPVSHYAKIYLDQPVVELVDMLQKSFFESGKNGLKKDNVRSVLVYDRSENFLGIIRFSNLLKLVLPPFLEESPYTSFFTGMFLAQCKVIGKRSIHEIMDRPVSVDINAPLMVAIHLMVKHHLINLPVMKGQKLAGILRERDIIFSIAQNMGIVK